VRLIGSSLAVLTALALGACGEDEPTPKGGGPPAVGRPADEPSATTSATLVELLETNVDGFAEPLEIEDEEESVDPVWLDEGVLYVRESLLASVDGEALAAAGVRLADPTVPLARCRAIAVHTIVYAGRGREGVRRRVVAGPAFPLEIPLERAEVPAALEHDLGTATGSLEDAAKAIRLVSADAVRLEADGAQVLARYGDRRGSVAPGGWTDFPEEKRSVPVREAGIAREDVLWSSPPDESTPTVVVGPFDHGAVEFSTRLRVLHRGQPEVRPGGVPPPSEGDDEGLR
jgi:hypothetical protein